MKKRSPPHILADEHFDPPAAEQRSYRTPDRVLKPVMNIFSCYSPVKFLPF